MNGHYYFRFLTEEQRLRFLNNCNGRNVLDDWYPDMKRFIGGNFSWVESEEGLDYWSDLYNNVKCDDEPRLINNTIGRHSFC